MKSIHDAICHTCIHKNNLFPCRNIHLHHNGLNSHILYVQMFIKKKNPAYIDTKNRAKLIFNNTNYIFSSKEMRIVN